MRKTVRKWFWVWDFDKEEQWLNEMAAKGLALIGTGFCRYDFEDCTPGEYQVRLELLENHLNHAESQKYIQFIESTGAEQVGNYFRWVYFRKKTAEGPFDLYSDLDSRISHLEKIARLLLIITVINVGVGVMNSYNPFVHLGWINLLCAALLTYGLGRIHGKKEALEKERRFRE